MTASAERLTSSGPEPFEACPDGGRCWHACPLLPASEKHPEGEGKPCWRVANAEPLSSHNRGMWTYEEKTEHDPSYGPFETEIERVRGAALRLRNGVWKVDLALADLLDALADRHDEIVDTLPVGSKTAHVIPAGNVHGWPEAVALAKTYLGEI